MADINKTYRLSNNTVATLKMKSVERLLQETGLTQNGSLQALHTGNVLRRILKYWAARSGMTMKVVIAQTDVNKPQIVSDTPYSQMLFTGKSAKGKDINYTTTKNPLAGPRPDKAVEAAEGTAMAADLQRAIQKKGFK